MSETTISTKSKKFHHLNEFQRGKIEVLLKMKISKAEIARQIGISRSTLYEELKRGTVTQMKSDLTYCKKKNTFPMSDKGFTKFAEKIVENLRSRVRNCRFL